MKKRFAAWIGLWALCACTQPVSTESEALTEGEGATCVAVEDEATVRSRFTATLFPESAEDTPYACRLGTETCEPELFHLDPPLPWTGQPPALAQCRAANTQPLVRRCDRYAKHLLARGLDEGSLVTLLEGATRLRDVMRVVERRAPAMRAYRLDAPENLFATWLRGAGVQPAMLGACAEGSADERNLCLAEGGLGAAGPRVVRGLLQLLDHHNGVLVRAGRLDGAAARQLAIFASATGPRNVALARHLCWEPRRPLGTFLPQTLAKVFSLRLVDGTAEASAGSELDAYRAMRSYEPASELDLFSAELGLLTAQVAAYGWDERIERPARLDHQAADDLHTFFATLRMTALTAQALGQCGLRDELFSVYRHAAAGNVLPKLDRELKDFGSLCFEDRLDRLEGLIEGRLEACGFRSYDQQLVAYTVSESREETVAFDEEEDCVEGSEWEGGEIVACDTICFETFEQVDCIPDELGETPRDSDCIPGTVPAGQECTTTGTVYWEAVEAEAWVDYGEEVVELGGETYDIDEVLETTLIVESVRGAYRALLSSEDEEEYDHTGDGSPDLNYDIEADDATILRAGVGLSECFAELQGSAEDYAEDRIGALSCPTDEGEVDAGCVLAGLGLDEHEFIPYAVAVRLCPEYVADLTGVDTANAGSLMLSCTTPWSFTRAVHTFLATGFIDDTAALNGGAASDPWHNEAGETERTTLMDFAQEALALSQPVSAMYRHRADFASVAGDVPGASSESAATWYDDHVGLHYVDHWLTLGEDMMGRGLALVADFDALVLDGEPGSEIIAELARDALATCQASGCDDNGTLHARALYWRRVRDAIESYDRLGGGRLEMQWRRLDGDICHDDDTNGTYDRCLSCFVGVDEDGDGLADALSCDADGDLDGDGVVDVEGCESQCGYHEAAVEVVDESEARLGEVAAMLEAQRGAIPRSDANHTDLDEFLDGAARYALGASAQRALELDALTSGRDWLGYKPGLWYPGLDMDPTEGLLDASDHVAEKVAELEAAAASASFDGLISDYLQRVAALDGFHDDVERQLAGASADVASYCSGGVDACVTEWSDDWAMVEAINGYLQDYVCGRTIELAYYDAASEQNRTLTREVGIPAEDCPVFVSPDLAALGAHTGSIPLQGAALEAALVKVEVAIADIDAYVATVEANNEARAALGEVLESQAETEERIEALVDGIVCGAAVVGAIGVSVVAGACAGATGGICGAGGGAIAVTSAWSGAASTCASVYSDDAAHWVLDAPTQAEVQRAYTEYSMQLQANQEAYTLSTKMLALTGHAADYALETAELLTLQAALDQRVAYQNVVFDTLYDSYLFDPSAQLFDEESLGVMKNQFREYARLARDLHHLVQYDLGQSVREGAAFSLSTTDTYYFPRLAELTVFKGRYADFASAYLALESATGDERGVGAGERAFNLVAYASLLETVHGSFQDVYDGRNTTGTVWVGGSSSSLPGVDLDGDGWVDDYDAARAVNPGEWAVLADSVFFDPFGHPSEGCAVGQVDLADYCSRFTDTGASVPEDTCLDVAALPARVRYDLAHLDHMTHGVGVEPFACWTTYTTECAEEDEHGRCVEGGDVYAPWIDVAADADGDGVFTFAELGGVRAASYDAGDPTYWAAQTPTVRTILDRFLEEVGAHGAVLDSDDLEVHPGTFLFLVDFGEGSPHGYTTAGFDPEADVLVNAPEATDTVAEHLTAMTLVCTDEHTCPDADNPYEAEVFLLGRGYLGSRCLQADGGRQERVGFDLEPDPVLVPAERYVSDLDANALTRMSDPELLGRLGAQPVHGNSMIVALPAHADFNQNQREVAGESTAWSLYRSADSTLDGPRLRVAMRFAYYDATARSGDFDYDVVGLLQCHTPGDAMCVNGSCP